MYEPLFGDQATHQLGRRHVERRVPDRHPWRGPLTFTKPGDLFGGAFLDGNGGAIGDVAVDVSAALQRLQLSIIVGASLRLGGTSLHVKFELPKWLSDGEFMLKLAEEIAKKAYEFLAEAMKWVGEQLKKLGIVLEKAAQDVARFWKGVAEKLNRTAEEMDKEIQKIADTVAATCNVAAKNLVAALCSSADEAARILRNLYGLGFDAIKDLLDGHFPGDAIRGAIENLPGGKEFFDLLDDTARKTWDLVNGKLS